MKRLLTGLILMALFSQAVRAQIDLHCHIIPASYLDAVKARGMEMDEAEIQTSVLTMSAPQPFFGDVAESAAICRKFNEEAAALKALHPGRFLFCAALPLPDVEAAIAEARYALEGRLAAHGLNPEDVLSNNAKSLFNIQ